MMLSTTGEAEGGGRRTEEVGRISPPELRAVTGLNRTISNIPNRLVIFLCFSEDVLKVAKKKKMQVNGNNIHMNIRP